MPRSSDVEQVLEQEHLVDDLLRQVGVVLVHAVDDRFLVGRSSSC